MVQAPPALDPSLLNVLLIANVNIQNAIIGQGINNFDAFWSLKDDDIRLLCANIQSLVALLLTLLLVVADKSIDSHTRVIVRILISDAFKNALLLC
jgi:hypothetical protein